MKVIQSLIYSLKYHGKAMKEHHWGIVTLKSSFSELDYFYQLGENESPLSAQLQLVRL